MNFQWYPGHMTKAKRMMQENIKLIDVMVELVDARIPFSSKNPDIDQLARDKYRVLILNKTDMADPQVTEAWETYYKNKNFYVAKVNSQRGEGIKEVRRLIQTACKEKKERDRKRGILNRPVRAMIAGIPNVGKSTFINSFAGKACAKTGNKPGVTKGKQWIKINKDVELLDTPGILWPKFEDQQVGLRLAFIGSIKEEILPTTEVALELIPFLISQYHGVLADRYQVREQEDPHAVLEEIAVNRGCLTKGSQTDIDKAGRILLDDYRSVRLGRISLELIPFLIRQYPGVLADRYQVREQDDSHAVLEEIAVNRGCLTKGSQTDIDKAGRILLDDYRSVRLGRISLERPVEE